MIKLTGCPSLLYVNPDYVESIYIRQEEDKYLVFLSMASGHQHTIPHDKMEDAKDHARVIAGWKKAMEVQS